MKLLIRKQRKKRKNNKKESEVASVTCTRQASASEPSPAPRKSLGKRYVLPQFVDILVLSHRFFSLPSCISVIPLHITNILILVFPPFSSDRESPIDTSERDETYLPNPSSAVSETSTKHKKRGRPFNDTTQ